LHTKFLTLPLFTAACPSKSGRISRSGVISVRELQRIAARANARAANLERRTRNQEPNLNTNGEVRIQKGEQLVRCSSPSMKLAVLGRLGACEKRLGHRPGTPWRREFSRVAIDLGEGDSFRHVESNALLAGGRVLHELRPDGERRLAAAQRDGLVV